MTLQSTASLLLVNHVQALNRRLRTWRAGSCSSGGMHCWKFGAASEQQPAWERGEQGRRLLPRSKAMRRSCMVCRTRCCGLVLMATYARSRHWQAADSIWRRAAAHLRPYAPIVMSLPMSAHTCAGQRTACRLQAVLCAWRTAVLSRIWQRGRLEQAVQHAVLSHSAAALRAWRAGTAVLQRKHALVHRVPHLRHVQ